MHISHSVHLTCISLAGRLDPLKVSAPKNALDGKVPVALPTSSGASALHVALLACNLGPQELQIGHNRGKADWLIV